MSTLLRDVIDIPKSAGAEDYVLRLTDSVGHAAARRAAPVRAVRPHEWTVATGTKVALETAPWTRT